MRTCTVWTLFVTISLNERWAPTHALFVYNDVLKQSVY